MSLQKFPGLIDIHVHLRDPGATQKEDFSTGSRAAAVGGFTIVCDMPNNYQKPTFTSERLDEKIHLSQKKSIIDIGFHFGTDGKNIDQFPSASASPFVFGLKVYLGETTGGLVIKEEKVIDTIFSSWNSDKPILVHAEGTMIDLAISLARTYKRRLHICHIANLSDLRAVRMAKEQGQMVTVGVTPHHLYLETGDVKPSLTDTDTRDALWEALQRGHIDIIESDHAPHTREEKESATKHFGFPGLETTLGLCLKAVKEGKLPLGRVIDLLYTNPKDIFSIPTQKDTFIELDPDESYVVGADGYQSKCQWSPFDGWELYGRIQTVVLRGTHLVRNGILVV